MKAPCVGMEGKMLPSVTTEDNGDVLMVVDGEWSKGETSGGGGVLVCNGIADGNTVTLDHTWQEIFDAPLAVLRPIPEGEVPVCIANEFRDADGEVYTVIFLNLADEGEYMDFTCNTADGYPSATFG